jgi:hypothetical protein
MHQVDVMSLLKKIKEKTEETAKKTVEVGKDVGEKGLELGKDVGEKGLELGLKAGQKGVELGKKGITKVKDAVTDKEDPFEILKLRYAKGEITKAEYLEMKHTLEES